MEKTLANLLAEISIGPEQHYKNMAISPLLADQGVIVILENFFGSEITPVGVGLRPTHYRYEITFENELKECSTFAISHKTSFRIYFSLRRPFPIPPSML